MSDNIKECIAEMRCFIRGGIPGVAQLERVYKNIFLHYDIFLTEDKCSIFNSLSGLHPIVRNRMMEEVGWVNHHQSNKKKNARPRK